MESLRKMTYITREEAVKQIKRTIDKVLYKYKNETGDDSVEGAFTHRNMPPRHLQSLDNLSSDLLFIDRYGETFLFLDTKAMLLYVFNKPSGNKKDKDV